MESFRDQDMRAEQQLGEFMDTYFYSRLRSKIGRPLNFIRTSDKERQISGIDVCIESEGKKILIDEKASVYYSNAMIPTFAFELLAESLSFESAILSHIRHFPQFH